MRHLLLIALLAVVPLGGCGTISNVLGVEQVEPQTPKQRLAFYEATYTGLAVSLATYIDQGWVDKESGKAAEAAVYAALVAARTSVDSGSSDQLSLLIALNTALQELSKIVADGKEKANG